MMTTTTHGARLAFLLALAAWPLPRAGAALAPPRDPELAAGIALARAGDFQGALLELDETVRRLEAAGAPDPELAQGYLYLAISYLELGQELPAVERFRAAVLRDPGLRLDPAEFSPQVIRFFEAARQEVAAMRAPGTRAPATSPAARAAPKEKTGTRKTVLLVVAAGAAVAATVAIASGGDDSPPTTTMPGVRGATRVGAVAPRWTSHLETPGTRGQIRFDGALVPPGDLLASGAAPPGRHHVEGVLVAPAAGPGAWRFDLPGIRPGSVRVIAGVAAPGRDAVSFRLAGRAGERVAFTFETGP